MMAAMPDRRSAGGQKPHHRKDLEGLYRQVRWKDRKNSRTSRLPHRATEIYAIGGLQKMDVCARVDEDRDQVSPDGMV